MQNQNFDTHVRREKAFLQPQKLDIMVRGSCEGTSINILIDTGGNASLASTRLIDQLNLIDKIRPTSIKIAGLAQKVLPMRGQVQLKLKVGKDEIDHKFIVCDFLPEDILAGNDVLVKLGACIDIAKRKFKTKSGSIKFLEKPEGLAKVYKVKASKTVIIKANTAGYITGKLASNEKTTKNYEGVVLGYKKLTESTGLCIENAIVYSHKNIVPIRYINPLPCDVTIHKNRIVAMMEPVDCGQQVKGIHRVSHQTEEYDPTVNIPRKNWADPEEITREKGKWENIEDLYKQLGVDDIDIPQELKNDLKNTLEEYSCVFSKNKYDLGLASFYEAKLKLKQGYQARWVPSREIAYKLRPTMQEEISKLSEAGQLENCRYSEFNSPVFLVAKPDGKSHRMVQDLRQVNCEVLPDGFEIGNVNRIMDEMTECKYLSSFDFTKGFCQIRLEKESRPITAFTFKGERYQWKTLPQGQSNSSAIFARAMAQLFSKIPFQAFICFLDDILIGSNTAEEHLKRLRFVLAKLSWANLKISPAKTQLFRSSLRFLGQIISAEGLQIDPERVEAILKLKEPTKVRELQKFLGILNFNRSYVDRFSVIAKPLYDLLQKDKKFDWTDSCQKAFDGLKQALTKAPILAIPQYDDPHKSYEINVDSSKVGHASTLTQWINGERRIISYYSRAVQKHHQKNSPCKLEFLGLYYSIMHYKIYLLATEFIVNTDCKALLNINTIFKNEGSYMQRRLSELQNFKFKIRHVAGDSDDIVLVDYLSRNPIEVEHVEVGTQTEEIENYHE